MAEVRHVAAGERLVGVEPLEQKVLAQQRGGVIHRIAEWNQDRPIGEQPGELPQARQVAVVLGEVTGRAGADPQARQLADMLPHEGIELGAVKPGVRAPGKDPIRAVLRRVEGPPQDFFKGLGAVEADADAIALGPFNLAPGGVETPGERVPQERNEQKRHVSVSVRGEARQGGYGLQQQGRAGPGQGGDEHRPGHLDAGRAPGVEAVFQFRQGLLQGQGGKSQPVQQALQPAVTGLQGCRQLGGPRARPWSRAPRCGHDRGFPSGRIVQPHQLEHGGVSLPRAAKLLPP